MCKNITIFEKKRGVVSLYDNLPFIFVGFMMYMPSNTKKHQKYRTRNSPDRQNVFIWTGSKLRESLMLVFAQNSGILH